MREESTPVTSAAPRAPEHTIRILIADREKVFRLGLAKLFAGEDDLCVVGQAEELPDVLRLARELEPDLLFLQAEILAEELTNVVTMVRRESAMTKVVVTGSVVPEEQALSTVRAGASGVILKSTDPALFVKCARKVMENEVWLPKKEVAKLLDETQARSARPADTLTRREKAVISYLVQGWRNREIAERLSIREQTVKNHLRSIYDKVGVSDRVELVLYALYQRLELPAVNTVTPCH